MRRLLISLLFLYVIISWSNAQDSKNGEVNIQAIEHYIENLVQRQGIPGVSVAIIKNDEVIHKQNIGYANIEHQVPISDSSIFRLYSLTKPIVSVAVFQLIEAGQLSLDDIVSKYITDLPEGWHEIRIEHLLSHSSGLPDMAPIPTFKDLTEEEAKDKVFNQELRFSKGERYEYNQTGFWLLQKIIEKVTGLTLEAFVQKHQFGMENEAFFSSDSRDIVMNRATPYFPFSKGEITIDHSYLQGTYAHAENGLNITMDDFIDWDRQLRKHQLLSAATMDSMWESFTYSRSEKIFAHGWDKLEVNGHMSYGFTGSLCTAYRVFPDEQLSIIFLSNGLSYWYSLINAINHIASMVDSNIVDLNNLAFESLLQASVEKNIDDFVTEYKELKSNPLLVKNDFESHLNDIGYFWLRSLKNVEKAIKIFKFNTREHPKSWNTYDSLGEAHENNGNLSEAIVNYKKAIGLNTDTDYKDRMTKKVEELLE